MFTETNSRMSCTVVLKLVMFNNLSLFFLGLIDYISATFVVCLDDSSEAYYNIDQLILL